MTHWDNDSYSRGNNFVVLAAIGRSCGNSSPCFYRYCINVDGSPQPTVQAPTGGNTTLMLTEANAIKRPWLDHAGKTSGRLSGHFEIVASSTFNGGRSVRPAIPRFMIAPLATYCPED
jgi:hypothetical protein